MENTTKLALTDEQMRENIIKALDKKTALAVNENVNTLLPVASITDGTQAVLFYRTAAALSDKGMYKACKILAKVRAEKLFARGDKPAKTFNQWAENNGISKSKANGLAKIGEWIDENGDNDIFFELTSHNFGTACLTILYEKTAGKAQAVRDLIGAGKLSAYDTAEKIKELFKLDPKKEIQTDTESTEKAADDTDEKAPENTEKAPAEKLYKVALQFTRADLQAVKDFFKANEKAEYPAALLAIATACAKLIKD